MATTTLQSPSTESSPSQVGSWFGLGKETLVLISIAIFTFSWFFWVLRKSRKGTLPLPPGPRGLPLIGNLPFIEPDLHRYFAKLSSIYGQICKVKLGNKVIVILNSPAMAKEILKDQDIIFSNHDDVAGGISMTYEGSDIVWSRGAVWRMLRKVCVQEVLNNGSIEAGRGIRQRQLYQTLRNLYTKVGTPVNITEEITETIFNSMTSMLWGETVKGGIDARVAAEFRQVMGEIVHLLGQPNISDLFPVVARFDLQGVRRKMKGLMSWFDKIFDSILEQRQGVKSNKKDSLDFLDILLKIEEQADPKMPLTMTQVKALLLDMVAAGTDTTSTTLEWAMAEMLLKPETLKKARDELDALVGRDSILEDYHVPKLPYLDAVVKEVLRLHPPNPFLIPHTPSETCVVNGYTVPKNSGIYVNSWAIQRDPSVWENANDFIPERFLNTGKWDYKGNDFRYIPFGSGRRICPGVSLAEKSLGFVLGSLLHSFNWQLPKGAKLDLDDQFGQILRKRNPVILIPTPRLSKPELYAQFSEQD
ncbi:flavonoid 3'-monooxygenase CYP75B137-like [Tasmannia lanceolata]|uniref:flavonoid 3'-monooxygenase CYP75B137-like n=1 Tax=Tasmannia lanceolata TaxID=3420 RepID=UPI004063AD89